MQKTSLLSSKKEYAANFGTLKGGLNLFDPSYRLKSDESPDMLNLLWRDGMLRSRKPQEWIILPFHAAAREKRSQREDITGGMRSYLQMRKPEASSNRFRSLIL